MKDILVNIEELSINNLFEKNVVTLDEILSKLEDMMHENNYLEERIYDLANQENDDDYDYYIADIQHDEKMINA